MKIISSEGILTSLGLLESWYFHHSLPNYILQSGTALDVLIVTSAVSRLAQLVERVTSNYVMTRSVVQVG